jgi:chloramphenicol O-acetyltransferase
MSNLAEKSLSELTAYYNELPSVKPVKKFRDKPTALKRIQEMSQEEAAPKKETTKSANGKLPRWIAFKSITEADYRVRLESAKVLKYGRPHDHNGKPMVASKTKVEEALSS